MHVVPEALTAQLLLLTGDQPGQDGLLVPIRQHFLGRRSDSPVNGRQQQIGADRNPLLAFAGQTVYERNDIQPLRQIEERGRGAKLQNGAVYRRCCAGTFLEFLDNLVNRTQINLINMSWFSIDPLAVDDVIVLIAIDGFLD